ncbi:glucose 1-dehydrogenase [Exiguobacterium sp. PFWT01]|uniref:glucose 1-dehydrogenase n=1 Tax=Exiguobacterium sp. PFWT01 TaxID=2829816 RepID=UPI001BA73466|nr:glucose 1-dehydrogenase [Exiguobacterium sp. PFWT01]QUP88532.1 glucose 1-dehydrogenase [Exiguobacterium sp. PFWT01]
MKLSEKTAIVTGAGSGMGRAIAKLFAQEGARVVAFDLNEDAVQAVVDEIKAAGGEALGIAGNVTNQTDIDNLVGTAKDTFGSVDILVNNAGIMDNFLTVGEVTDELWDKVLGVNLTGPMKLSRAAIQVMEKQNRGGVIINNASVGGLFGTRGGAAYVASKHALIGLTKNIAATHGTLGKIRANAIAPGGVNTNIGSTITAPSELGMRAIQGTGEAPMGEPEQIANVALFLASDDSSFVNGDVLKADGGWTAR